MPHPSLDTSTKVYINRSSMIYAMLILYIPLHVIKLDYIYIDHFRCSMNFINYKLVGVMIAVLILLL